VDSIPTRRKCNVPIKIKYLYHYINTNPPTNEGAFLNLSHTLNFSNSHFSLANNCPAFNLKLYLKYIIRVRKFNSYISRRVRVLH
jgi:hypothetical protein